MNAVEKLEAAITKLEAEHASAEPGVWALDSAQLDQPGFMFAPRVCAGCGRNCALEPEDAALIVTLHRTIEPQLVTLRAALGDSGGSHDEPGAFESALKLADAILGVSDADVG